MNGVLLLALLSAAGLWAVPRRPQASPAELAAQEAAALKALIQRAVSIGEALPVPTVMGSSAQDMLNASRPGGGDVVESDPWGKKRFSGPGLKRSGKEDMQLAAGMSAAGMAMAVGSDSITQAMAEAQAKAGAKFGQGKDNPANNLAGLPAKTPSRALRLVSGSGHFAVTRVFYVLLGPAGEPVRLVWRQTRGDTAAISSRSIYYVSDVDGGLMDVVEKGVRFQRRAAARLQNDDKEVAERFKREKQAWLGSQ